jgi:hypothetical protein
MQASTSPNPRPNRVIIFMTHERPVDVPGHDQLLACMLPLGTASFAERVMDSLALAGVRQIDLVLSEHPEALRAIIQDGSPWGIKINWHHAKESAAPYAVLRGIGLATDDQVIIGHAHQWVSSRIVRELMHGSSVAMHVAGDVVWTGWFSTTAKALSSLGPHSDFAVLAQHARSMQGARCVIAAQTEFAQALNAADLLESQQHALDGTLEAAIPASWLRMPWGAASPDAVIHGDAKIHGPVLVGPGCVVEAGAELGPASVLTRDVFVADGARVCHSLVLANTYVGGQIALENAIAQGNSIQSLKWDVQTVLSPQDAMMTPLRESPGIVTPWASRFLAAVVASTLLPCLLVALALQKLLTGNTLWNSVKVVQARISGEDRLLHQTIRESYSDQALDRGIALYGGLLDIAQGRRTWFGLRPRHEAEWYALGRDWQDLFSRTAIGLFHAPAWVEGEHNLDSEALAVADAFMAVQSNFSARVKILCTNSWRVR